MENSLMDFFAAPVVDLAPELVPYFETHGPFPMIRHPLVYSMFHTPQMNRMANAMLQQKVAMLAKALAEMDIDTYVMSHERPYRVEALREFTRAAGKDYATDEAGGRQFWDCVAQVHCDTENLWQNHRMWFSIWTRQPQARMQWRAFASDIEGLHNLPDEMTVYRGSIKGLPLLMSWTTDLERAQWFSLRLSEGLPVVHIAKVKKTDIIAFLSRRGESEVVLDPALLNNVYTVETLKGRRQQAIAA